MCTGLDTERAYRIRPRTIIDFRGQVFRGPHGTAKLMPFEMLKRFKLDIAAEVEAEKSLIEQRFENVADRAKHVALNSAIIVASATFAALFLAMAICVGLFALYQTETATYGVDVALAVVAGVLIVATVLLIGGAVMIGRSLSRAPSSEPRSAPTTSGLRSTGRVQFYAPTPTDSANDLLEPLDFLLGKYIGFPALGHPALDDFMGKLRVGARGPADEAIVRAANLMRHGDRSQLLALLGGAAFVGWLLARQTPAN